MKRIFLITLAVLMGSSLFLTSCKKKVHPTHPTPANNRILSYTKFTSTSSSTTVINETFTFYYDTKKRVTQILYSSNEQAKVIAGTADLSITFVYSNDTIYKTSTAVKTAIVVERDTFHQMLSSGLISEAYTPGDYRTYQYHGKLIAGNTKTVSDSGVSISATTNYTSDNGDLLNHVYDGTLHASFPDSGLNFVPVPHHDFLSVPLTVTWTDFGLPIKTTTHTATDYNDVLTGYTSGAPVAVQAVDGNGVVMYDTLIWPGNLWQRESYYVYPELDNRPGDFLQIESFTTYGTNIYLNAHMIKYIYEQDGPKTEVLYNIDADSKVTQTYVTTTDLYGIVTTVVYKLQYELF